MAHTLKKGTNNKIYEVYYTDKEKGIVWIEVVPRSVLIPFKRKGDGSGKIIPAGRNRPKNKKDRFYGRQDNLKVPKNMYVDALRKAAVEMKVQGI